MLQKRYIGLVLLLLMAVTVSAQKAERDFIRKGNRFFKDSVYVNAEVNYRKALEVNPQSIVSMFNLGNTLAQQNKLQEAMEQYVAATKMEKNKDGLAQIYHNMGVIFQSQKDYAKAVEAYKQSLRNNPKDDETRYNLALAQKMLNGIKRLVFVIGGPYGFSEAVYRKADELLSLSKMTFSHQMVRLIFVEQLYRAMNILNGGPYHHE